MNRSAAVTLGALLAVVCLAAGFLFGTRIGPPVPHAAPPPLVAPPPPERVQEAPALASCPELASLNPALVELPLETLESQYVAGLGVPPSMAKDSLEGLKASLVSQAPERRACVYRVMLIHARGGAAAVRKIPGAWGLDKPSAEIARSFLELPMRGQLSGPQREDLLAQVEEYVIPHLQADTAGDREHWRRQYYGLLLTCEAADEALLRLEAQRPRECLTFRPRDPPRRYVVPAPEGRPLVERGN